MFLTRGKRGKTTHSRCFARGKVHFCRKSERKGSLVPEFLREPPERGWVDTLPLRSGKNSSVEIEARQHAEGLQV
jgi:hypothetical protein